jgi:putative zinc finger/helix-turn-helix YgiT family protein
MICLNCDNEDLKECDSEVEQIFRGETFKIPTRVMRCDVCKTETVAQDAFSALRIAVADAYRVKVNRLTSAQIRKARNELGLTQKQFADLIGVGEASIKRWETWQVQENSSNELMIGKIAEAKASKADPMTLIAANNELLMMHSFVVERSAIRDKPKKFNVATTRNPLYDEPSNYKDYKEEDALAA